MKGRAYIMNKILTDRLMYTDSVKPSSHPRTLWAKTQIIGGYGLHKNKYGISELDEVVFDTENMVPLVGVQYAMETLFGVKGPLTIPTLNSQGIGSQHSIIDADNPYPKGQYVCLFGVGTGGAKEENNLSALEVKYNETFIKDMVPFRFTNVDLSDTDALKYFGKKQYTVGDAAITAYFLKKFESDPVIYHLYKDGEEGEDGTVVSSDFFNSDTITTGVQSFTECVLAITKKDIREWFEVYGGNVEVPRVNSIALFTAIYNSDDKDYSNIQLFSKLNIPTEPLSLVKDMNILYRVYGA